MRQGQVGQAGRIDSPGRAARVLDVRRLGVVPYADALALQRSLVEDRRAGGIGDVLLLLGTDFPYRNFYPEGKTVIQVDVRGPRFAAWISGGRI